MSPRERLDELARVAALVDCDKVEAAAKRCVDTLYGRGTIYVCGNGGSAAQANHFAAELMGRYSVERTALSAVSLCADQSVLTCIANDYGYEMTFSRQVEALVHRGDLLLCLSTSGESENVIGAAFECLGTVVAVTGSMGVRFPCADQHIQIPSTDTAIIQELTLSVLHSICETIDEAYS